MADVAEEIMVRNELQGDDIAWLVPHQANKRIIDATAERMHIPEEKVMINIERYGNTTAGTLPLCLWEWEDKLHKGDNLCAGSIWRWFHLGCHLIKWAYDPNNQITYGKYSRYQKRPVYRF